jgi:ABC-type Mn2+/Zn2+ transport system permease subunit
MTPLAASIFSPALVAAVAMAVACAALSLFVVSRHWAFIGEGISHSGFGGAGTAWVLALIFPGSFFEAAWMPYLGVVVFSLFTAAAIGYLTRARRLSSDSVIGIFMVASFAWGIVAQGLYRDARGANPVGWTVYLFGEMRGVPWSFAIASAFVSLAVVGAVSLLFKELLYYSFDPAMAEASGVRAGVVHYLLILLVALTIVIGTQIVGAVLVTALLILPGATALLLSARLRGTVLASVAVALGGTVCGLAISQRWHFLPTGPAIVLVLFLLFIFALAWAKLARAR